MAPQVPDTLPLNPRDTLGIHSAHRPRPWGVHECFRREAPPCSEGSLWGEASMAPEHAESSLSAKGASSPPYTESGER